jgi:geranylgeranyl pyrophosphate synthase
VTNNQPLAPLWTRWREQVDQRLEILLPAPDCEPCELHQAMRYASIGAGKRYRAALVYASGAALGTDERALDIPACALELIHAFSLIHDDLPAMDDDDLRRGKPSCHRAFNEATAILAGDALQTLAFEALCTYSTTGLPSARQLQMVQILAHAAGSLGLAGGQAIDLDLVACDVPVDTLATMHRKKTGALIEAAVQLGALTATGDSVVLQQLTGYARPLGLAFQVVDDILDGTADTATLGKLAGADRLKGKPTFLSALGESASRHYAQALGDEAIAALDHAPFNSTLLIALVRFTIERSH